MTDKIVRKDSDEGRTYETPNGELKSVTNFLGILNKPALVPWAAKMSAEYFKDEIDAIVAGELDIRSMDIDDIVKNAKAHYKKKSEEATQYGSMVHQYVTEYFGFGQLPEDPVVNKLVISAIAKITGELRMTVTESEKMVYYRKAYAGTLDLIGDGQPVGHKTPKRIIVDIKTGRGRVYEEALIQVSAYALAEEELQKRKVDLAVILPLNKDTGEADDLVVLSRRAWKKYAKAFLALVEYDRRIVSTRVKK
jgi:CRISPR/Cas system-associated exonuclease Cas4 (RecB family)